MYWQCTKCTAKATVEARLEKLESLAVSSQSRLTTLERQAPQDAVIIAMQAELSSVKKEVAAHQASTSSLATLAKDLDSLRRCLEIRQKTLLKDIAENINRCRNIVLSNVPEPHQDHGGRRREHDVKAVEAILAVCTDGDQSIKPSRQQRLGKWVKAQKARPLLVELKTPADRDEILRTAHKLPISDWSEVGIYPDRPAHYSRVDLKPPRVRPSSDWRGWPETNHQKKVAGLSDTSSGGRPQQMAAPPHHQCG